MSESLPLISVLIPILNENNHLDSLLSSLIHKSKIGSIEFFLIDGGSTDGTVEKIEKWKKEYPFIHRVDNPRKFANFAFNEAYPLTKGKYVAFIGAHAEYPANFFSNGMQYLDDNECDAVGGPLHQKGRSIKGLAIAFAMSSKLGVGGTEFRTTNSKQYVDSVAFAIYKRELFDKIGVMDNQLIRNQDDELHYRMNAAGFRILMVPEMKCTYYVRETLGGVFKQYFQYGLFKPLVLRKVRSGIRIRHLIPLCFVLYLLSLVPLFLWIGTISTIPLILYLVLILHNVLTSSLSLNSKIFACLVFPTLHISYGIGFLLGLSKIYGDGS